MLATDAGRTGPEELNDVRVRWAGKSRERSRTVIPSAKREESAVNGRRITLKSRFFAGAQNDGNGAFSGCSRNCNQRECPSFKLSVRRPAENGTSISTKYADSRAS